jgi:dihydrofolate reductase
MIKLNIFNLITLDGYFSGEGGDISWHTVDADFQELAERASTSGNTLLFGRVTYELMAGFWPTDEARKSDPVVAKGMNGSPKVVFSRTLQSADWENTRLIKGDLIEEVKKLKRGRGKGLTVLGSGSIVTQLANAGLVDEYEILLNPVAIGRGRTLFAGLEKKLSLKLTKSRVFKNGNVWLTYAPA